MNLAFPWGKDVSDIASLNLDIILKKTVRTEIL